MARKKWSAQTDVSQDLLKFREKRKWQIAYRRYVIEKNASAFYAPYFGLDIENLRKWFEIQFENEIGWEDFGKKWQFDHIIPIGYFDFSDETELKMYWSFINAKIEILPSGKGNGMDSTAAKKYFEELYTKTSYPLCLKLLEKISKIEPDVIKVEKQQIFIIENREYLHTIENYSAFEFELLNSGRPISEVKKEIDFLKRFEK